MIYQAMFAIITPALLMGAVAERMKFKAFFIFTLLWSTLVYDPIAHWVWGTGGWIRKMGGLDFAGGDRGPYQFGSFGVSCSHPHGKTQGLWDGAHGSP